MDISFSKIDTFYKYLELRNGLDSKTGKPRKILSSLESKCFGIDFKKKGWANKDFKITEKQFFLAQELRNNLAKGGKRKFTRSFQMEVRLERNSTKAFDKKFLYLMRTIDTYYKIGVSDDPNKRLLSLQTGCPSPLSIEAVWEVKDAYLSETQLHKKFVKFNTHLEWFLFPRRIEIDSFEKNFDFEFKRSYIAPNSPLC